MDKKIKKLTSADNQKFFKTLTDDTMTNLIKFLCAKQDSLVACRTIMPTEVARMESTLKSIQKGKREEGQESFLLPFLRILND